MKLPMAMLTHQPLALSDVWVGGKGVSSEMLVNTSPLSFYIINYLTGICWCVGGLLHERVLGHARLSSLRGVHITLQEFTTVQAFSAMLLGAYSIRLPQQVFLRAKREVSRVLMRVLCNAAEEGEVLGKVEASVNHWAVFSNVVSSHKHRPRPRKRCVGFPRVLFT